MEFYKFLKDASIKIVNMKESLEELKSLDKNNKIHDEYVPELEKAIAYAEKALATTTAAFTVVELLNHLIDDSYSLKS